MAASYGHPPNAGLRYGLKPSGRASSPNIRLSIRDTGHTRASPFRGRRLGCSDRATTGFDGRRPNVVVRQQDRYIAGFIIDVHAAPGVSLVGVLQRAGRALPGQSTEDLPLPGSGRTSLIHLAPDARDEVVQRAVAEAGCDHGEARAIGCPRRRRARFRPVQLRGGATLPAHLSRSRRPSPAQRDSANGGGSAESGPVLGRRLPGQGRLGL